MAPQHAACSATPSVYIIDQRTRTPQGYVPPEDIVGAFAVKGGEVVPDSYRPCRKHQILSADGFFRLGPELQACLLEELAESAQQTAEPDPVLPGGVRGKIEAAARQHRAG